MDESINKTVAGLIGHGYKAVVVSTKQEALEAVKKIIPAGSSVMNGSSVTLEQIGFVDLLKSGTHGWNNLHAGIVSETDSLKQATLRKQALLSDYYVGSVHALTEEGEFVIGSNTGSQLPHIVYSSTNLIFVVSTKKIVPELGAAMKRLVETVVPLEDKHMMELYKMGTALNKIVIFKGESPFNKRVISFVLVKEDLGF
jgi:L-lactate utilization protein LutC